jgi:MOSC domain-containing protein YiiM
MAAPGPFLILPVKSVSPQAQIGRVASLHLHPALAGQPMLNVSAIDVVAEKGILSNPRHFDRSNRWGQPNARQISLIEQEQIAEHAAALGLRSIPPGAVRSNIETTHIDLIALIGKHVQIGQAVLHLHSPRTPCGKMDAIAPGLRELMKNGRQGVIASVVHSGRICAGDTIEVLAIPVAANSH